MSDPLRAHSFDPSDVQALLLTGSPGLTAVRYLIVELDSIGFSVWLTHALDEGHLKHLRAPVDGTVPTVSVPPSPLQWDQPDVESTVERSRWNLNVGFTHAGLGALGCRYRPRPASSLVDDDGAFTDAFRDGMARRQAVAWSAERTAQAEHPWHRPLTVDREPHALLWITGVDIDAVDQACDELFGAHDPSDLIGSDFSGGSVLDVLDASQLDGFSHFGFLDGTSQPYVAELHPKATEIPGNVLGGGQYAGHGNKWQPVRLGEFLLGHPHEGITPTSDIRKWVYDGPTIDSPTVGQLQLNGSFVVYRRLEENVAELARWVDVNVAPFRRHLLRQPRHRGRDPEDLSNIEVAAELTANLIGRYPHRVPIIDGRHIRWEWVTADQFRPVRAEPGAPLTSTLDKPTGPQVDRNGTPIPSNWFRYDDNDNIGRQCPLGAHIRRANPRDALGGANLTARHRIIRRSFPYGTLQVHIRDDTERGLAFLGVCANIEAQFEFVKREWLNVGHTLHTGADVDPIAGDFEGGSQKFVIQDPASPYVTRLADEPFVQAVYGEYFFAPSISALRQIALASGAGSY